MILYLVNLVCLGHDDAVPLDDDRVGVHTSRRLSVAILSGHGQVQSELVTEIRISKQVGNFNELLGKHYLLFLETLTL